MEGVRSFLGCPIHTLPHCLIAVTVFLAPQSAAAQTVTYRVTVPEPEHHWLQVEATFPDLGSAPLRAFMSRSSPGRYAVHEFAKNVFWLEAYDGRGRTLAPTRPSPYEWDVADHDGTVRIVYKVFGDLVDGTYLAVDATHAHMNMPATFMFDRDRPDRSIRVTFTAPAGSGWQVATQLLPTADPFTFDAPNLQYFMDSPAEMSDVLTTRFVVANPAGGQRRFRLAVHANATQTDVDELAALVERLVREQAAVFGEFPEYEPGEYTFLLDYRPRNDRDGMEHRNSTMISGSVPNADAPLRTAEGRRAMLGTISHEFFHNWNVERIRPSGLEPFDFTSANITCCLWLAEGFTSYYGPLLLTRAGLGEPGVPVDPIAVINGSGRQVRSAVQMSEYAPFVDAARSVDPNDQSRSFISYYTYGAAIALALDLSIRAMSNGRLSLDDYMRLLWERFGKASGSAPGVVAHPYTLADLRRALADLTGRAAFADEFFDKFIEGRDVPDYASLLGRAGFALRPVSSGAAWTGIQVRTVEAGLVVTGSLTPFGTAAYEAGLERDDVITAVEGRPATIEAWNAILGRRPGSSVRLEVLHRGGVPETVTLTLGTDPSLQIVDLGSRMTADQRRFRDAWLVSRVR
jgi:predicted metalloprotease with PDZ domain